jgi:hypothetical protein
MEEINYATPWLLHLRPGMQLPDIDVITTKISEKDNRKSDGQVPVKVIVSSRAPQHLCAFHVSTRQAQLLI